LLARQGAAVALLLPGVPETFSLALSDAWAAGVPVVAPAQGALSERLQHGGGHLVPANPSDDDVLSAIDRMRRLPVNATPLPPTANDAARRHLELYRRRGFTSAR
jgi:glycosyltransferase involved in cell wall biosynthesis